MQLALAISVSDPEAREDRETAQIKAAKQRSLGCPPSQTLVEVLSLRYWSNNVVNYDEKVMDGFYDVYGTNLNSVTQGKMPQLVDLQAVPVSEEAECEVILVDRTTDLELLQLEERVCNISLECQANGEGYSLSSLIQKIAGIVVDKMGGPVTDADQMLRKWNARSFELRSLLNTVVLPLGGLDVGLSRHRALLFKVLADKINLPCMLVKGSYYTGTDEGAVNLIKVEAGSEYIIDLMGAPGTLIPSEAPSCNFQSFGLDSINAGDLSASVFEQNTEHTPEDHSNFGISTELDGDSKFINLSSTISTSSSHGKAGKSVEKNQTERFENDFGKLLPSLYRSSQEGLLSTVGKSSAAQKLQVKDVSKYVISAAKNPDFASKLHAVLLENDSSQPLDLLDYISNDEKALIPFTESMFKNENQHAEVADIPIPCVTTTGDGFVLVSSGITDNNQSQVVVRTSDSEQLLLKGESSNSVMDKVGKVSNYTLDKEKSTVNNVVQNDRRSPMMGEVAEWEIPWEDLQTGERIGIGSFGEVYRAEWNGTEVAVKKFMNQDISGDALVQFKCEIEIMLRLRHPNVVLFMGAVTHPPNLSILTEFLPRGSLFKLLHRPNVQLDERRRMRMALDVAKGMNYLHTSNPIIVHRDLKTPNLLVDKNWVVKVCDFGMSRMKHHTFLSSTSTAGTPEWMAPEVLRNEPSNEKADVYSFGVILWELATLRVPWSEMNSMQVVGAVGFQHRHLDIPDDLDPVVAQIITDCWDPVAGRRPSFAQIISRLRHLQHLVVERKERVQR